jgi:NAD(P)-dependent dehydrogenase (short-subunit alcohol dehydrogenase family)
MTNEYTNYLVVGGNSGIGKAIVTVLADSGNNVWAASRSNSETYAELGVNYIECDITEDDLSFLRSKLPDKLHGLVYCPGTINLKPFRSLKIEDFRRDFELNALGAVRVLQACQKSLTASKNASVVMFSTVAARIGMSYHASIASAKAAVEGLAKSLAAEWARQNIRVNVIAPSLTDTPLAGKLLSDEKRREASAERHPLKRVGAASDIAAATRYLLSKDASWVTGQVISVDGGLSSVRPL